MVEVPLAARGSSVPTDVSADLAVFIKLLADRTRRRIFLLLMQGETCNCELTGLLGLPQNLISHHLRVLRQAGLVRCRRDRRDARWIYYWVDPEALAPVWGEFQALFSPAALGGREPQCGPLVTGCNQ
jgi:ArsR family transcriptional regulator, arsenate/arsenite/antimonite-responsive transcriptional repressor